MDITSVSIEAKTLAALVEYDLFPYIILREVREIRSDGYVGGNGYYNKPLVMLPYEAAREMYEKIKEARREYEAAERKAKILAMDKIRSIAPVATDAIHVYGEWECKKLEDK